MRDLDDSKNDELLTMLEDQQDEIESLQDQVSEAQLTISRLSSENSDLRKELQRKSAAIVSLNGKIERWSVSDIVLKQNEQLKRQNEELQQSEQKTREEAETMISTFKHEYETKEQELDSQIRQVSQREQIVRDMEASYKEKVAEEAYRISEKARAAAEEEYKVKRNAVYGVTMGSLLYGFFATILTACNSPRFIKDFMAFLDVLHQLISRLFMLAVEACTAVWKVKDMIPYQILNVIAAVTLVAVVFALIIGPITCLIGFLIYRTAKFYYQKFWDLISAVVALVSMGILVWFADEMTWITWNLIVVWMVIYGGYVLVRMMVWGGKSR